jgi:hypothetical protein
MKVPVWQRALEVQLGGLRLLRNISNVLPEDDDTSDSFRYDLHAMRKAEAFGWTENASRAVWAASAKVPGDASLNASNLPTQAAWWYFEEPLQVPTTLESRSVRGMLLAWVKSAGRFGLACSVWCDPAPEDDLIREAIIVPSQTLFFPEDLDMNHALEYIRDSYLREYGPRGPQHGKQLLGVDRYMLASEQFIRFILAACTWMGTVLPDTRIQVHRHLRKEAERQLGPQDPRGVKVIQLRKMEHHGEHAAGDGREYSHRWMVDGHFRQQACGTGRADRKLIWIDPYIKGPDDKPFVDKQRAWVVNR